MLPEKMNGQEKVFATGEKPSSEMLKTFDKNRLPISGKDIHIIP